MGSSFTPTAPPVKRVNTGGAEYPGKGESGQSAAGRMVRERQRGASRSMQQGQNLPGQRQQRQQQRQQHPPTRQPKPQATPAQRAEKQPYDPWASPYKTQGQFNQAVQKIAAQAYQPKLDTLTQEEQSQTDLSGKRENENEAIYKAYSEKANQAMQEAKSSMATIASQQATTGSSAANLLKAALEGGPAGLGQSPEQKSFLETAANESGFTSAGLAQKQSSIINELTQNATQAPLAGRNQARITEGQALTDAMSKLHAERGSVANEIPNDMAKARKELTQEEVNRAGTRLQRELAEQKIQQEGTIKGAEAQNKNIVAESDRERNAVSRENAREKAEAAKGAREEKERNKDKELHAKQWAAAQKWFNGYLKRGKTEFAAGITPAAEKEQLEKGNTQYKRNAQQAYDYVTKVLGLDEKLALRLVGSAGGYFKKFVEDREREAREKGELKDFGKKVERRGQTGLHTGVH